MELSKAHSIAVNTLKKFEDDWNDYREAQSLIEAGEDELSMNKMNVKILNEAQEANRYDGVRRVTIEIDGQEFIIEADAVGLVVHRRDNILLVMPSSQRMIHLTGWGRTGAK